MKLVVGDTIVHRAPFNIPRYTFTVLEVNEVTRNYTMRRHSDGLVMLSFHFSTVEVENFYDLVTDGLDRILEKI